MLFYSRQGGGHSALSPALGLAVDRVLQFKIVTPDGRYRTVNKCQNEDIFFALRGGGGGTFGVVLESTFVASPRVTLQVYVTLESSISSNVSNSTSVGCLGCTITRERIALSL